MAVVRRRSISVQRPDESDDDAEKEDRIKFKTILRRVTKQYVPIGPDEEDCIRDIAKALFRKSSISIDDECHMELSLLNSDVEDAVRRQFAIRAAKQKVTFRDRLRFDRLHPKL